MRVVARSDFVGMQMQSWNRPAEAFGKKGFGALVVRALVLLGLNWAGTPTGAAEKQKVTFEEHVLPILTGRC